jgi:hypothetical protein
MSATNRGGKRQAQDSYQTPAWCIDALLPYIDWPRAVSFVEPCRGNGHIYDRVPLSDKRYAELSEGIDYLATPFGPVDLIITNPPYSLALAFLEKSLAEASTVIYLLRLNFLASKGRVEFWRQNRPDHVLVLTPRPSFVNGGNDACEYAWICWDREGLIKTDHTFEFLARR